MNNIEQARSYIQTAPKAISGQGGDNTTFKVACTLVHGFALTRDDAMTLMMEYNARLDERWTRHQLNHKVECAAKSNPRLPPGYKLNRRAPFKPIRLPPAAERMTWKINRAPSRITGVPGGEAEMASEPEVESPERTVIIQEIPNPVPT